ncbi:asparagine synthase (glutamine-hydrolysing) [Desulfobaculum xiamenense]|uniref:asparagine synthase (glutamine-hydrolyzing) n=1 Tax=Desulfobaculum xiamenense TaxID=995050 RepID=A0A846QR33_9BACT|nr:asparagine synthase (glutamine-hydrolyzing) [Desulfobaculum xiamenense]NJB68942.1 asparagine synthase (glutamine-hydrolysing) [Desulfobaculum xiamenense]
MCGIAGFLAFHPVDAASAEAVAGAMADSLAHRGPDDRGVWVDAASGVGLGHRRLSILDLSPAGHQPMRSRCGRYVVVYNGEIYNHLALRRELAPLGHSFSGGSDTQTMLAAFTQWGIRDTLPRLRGMFAMAVWDTHERTLTLVRDRLGIKPLYHGQCGGTFIFGSELKALRAHPDFAAGVDRDALVRYLRLGYIPAPLSIHEGVRKLAPGTMLTVNAATGRSETHAYWSVDEVWERGAHTPFAGSAEDAARMLEDLATDAVRCRLISDVPLGAFLSGGIDSSTVVALMCRAAPDRVRTFSIGFPESGFDESDHAARVAAHLGTRHTSFRLGPADLLAAVPDIPRHFDEPFGDASQIPTLLLCRLAREHVTVCLSGDGGDELFSGYTRYGETARAWAALSRIPRSLRSACAHALAALPGAIHAHLGRRGKAIAWRADAIAAPDMASVYDRFLAHHPRPHELVPGASPPLVPPLAPGDPWHAMSRRDLGDYLPDDILTKVDRASMAVGLEARVPLLDHHLVEFAATLPTHLKRDGQCTKRPLRDVLGRHVPPELTERPKMGFTVPVEHWLSAELRDWCADMLAQDAVRAAGLLDPPAVTRIRDAYLAGQTSWHSCIWDMLMLQAWHDAARAPSAAQPADKSDEI